ncbi:hypothetical protein BS47DRAFT_1000945 [Hydnum rufescens UP504]|uniref:BTB domain-containing protein n=1 Tax=Hydnum rufescens UP504 TaxID=1448309 RepID=A0A9P6B8R0_9AGAM|nr:hypothetical protein BS47DRAFT_1000945 [Hydnum rufescens UP504]
MACLVLYIAALVGESATSSPSFAIKFTRFLTVMGSSVEHFISHILPPRPSAPIPPSVAQSHSSPIKSKGTVKRLRSESISSSTRDALGHVKKRPRAATSAPVPPPGSPDLKQKERATDLPSPTGVLFEPMTPGPSPRNVIFSSSAVWSDTSTPSRRSNASRIIFTPKASSDLVFRSNDGVHRDFYVDSQIVFDASPVLRFRASQLGTHPTGLVRAVNVVQIDEPAELIEAMLRLIYPHVRKPQITTSEELDHLLALCKRYQIAHGIHFLCARYLQSLARTEPLRAYGLACKHSLPAEVKHTSRETLRIDLSKADVSRDLAECHPAQIKALVHLHSRRAAAALAIISDASIEGLTCPGNTVKMAWLSGGLK